jgi:hypothetical protein
MNLARLQTLVRQWRNHAIARICLWAVTTGLLAAAALVASSRPMAIGCGLFSALLMGAWLWRRTKTVTPETVAAHLNRLRPEFEDSAALWLRDPATLTLVEGLQLRRLDAAWIAQPDRETLGQPQSRTLRPSLGACVVAEIILAAVFIVSRPAPPPPAPPPEPPLDLSTLAMPGFPADRPLLQRGAIVVIPPDYLDLPTRRIEGLDGEIPEGSLVHWEFTTKGDIAELLLKGAGQESVTAHAENGDGRFSAEATLTSTRFYQLLVTRKDRSVVLWPQLHTVKVIRDQPPQVTWQSPATARSFVEATDRPLATITVAASDDHGLSDVRLVMTVAKGSGEGVKFREREEVLSLAGEKTRERTYTRIFDLKQLGLEPGDELYIYVVASDSKQPVPNRTRSETRFIVLRGPSTALADPGTSLPGVNLMPQYFRSQRQLIIDTERLLAEQPTLTEEKFRGRSEDIGVDQKLLRLRYGQFLGEEFDPESSGAAAEARGMERAANLRSTPRADLERANAVDRAVEREHDHEPVAANREQPATYEQVIAPFAHQHDSTEKATLFESQVKASLRNVLAAMWEAEGLLRTAQPKRALPAENRALEMLKELQQADRVYVKRVGFEPAPLNLVERRLKGELETIPKSVAAPVTRPERKTSDVALRETLLAVTQQDLSQLPTEIADATGQSLTVAAEAQPERFVPALEIWQRRAAGLDAASLATLRQALWSLLPSAQETPTRSSDPSPALARDYFDALSQAKGTTG